MDALNPSQQSTRVRPQFPYRTSQNLSLLAQPPSSAQTSPETRLEMGYFPPQPVPTPAPAPVPGAAGWRRASEAAFVSMRKASLVGAVQDILNPQPTEMVQPFSFESQKTSYKSSLKLLLGLCGMTGYQLGAVLLVDSLFAIPGPANTSQGVGSGARLGADGMLEYVSPPATVGAIVFSIGILCGLASTVLFLSDGLRIAGNRNKAFTYASMHVAGIVLISTSKFIITLQKNHIPKSSYIALSLPSGIGRGLHFITIPRSFSNSEIVNGDFMHATFETRQILSEILRLTAAIFFGLWAASWSVQNYNPLTREGWGILASLTLNVSAALPNTNLRRADAFRRSQTNLHSPTVLSPPMSPEFRLNTFSPNLPRAATVPESIEPTTPGIPHAPLAASHTVI